MSTAPTGRLLLVPNTLDLGAETSDIQEVLPLGVLREAARLTQWVAENAKTTRAFLKRVDAVVPLGQPLQAIAIQELPRPRKGGGSMPPGANEIGALLAPAMAGEDIGLISEAGLPAVADPGAILVDAAHAAGVTVVPLPGPSSLMLALAASGLNGQSFAFVGYLPVDAAERAGKLRELEAASRRLGQTQLLIETPYRNAAMFTALTQALAGTTRLSISCGLTLANGWTRTQTIARWKAAPIEMPDRLPAVFGLLGQ
jgi:16S rRNA (cytidine1402-2'-O)-methyltransferase